MRRQVARTIGPCRRTSSANASSPRVAANARTNSPSDASEASRGMLFPRSWRNQARKRADIGHPPSGGDNELPPVYPPRCHSAYAIFQNSGNRALHGAIFFLFLLLAPAVTN